MFAEVSCTVFLMSTVFVEAAAFDWLNTPGTVRACVGGSAPFPWHYNSSQYTIQMTYWRFIETGKTVLGHHFEPRDSFVHYDYGPDRVEIMDPDVANAGLVLKKVEEGDEGRYRVELSGPAGASDEATLLVYTDDELQPTLQVDNRDIAFGAESNITACRTCIVVVTTAHALPADILVTAGENEVICSGKTTCSVSLGWSGDRSKSMRILFEIDYGFCDKYSSSVMVYWGDPSADDSNNGYTYLTDDESDKEMKNNENEGSALNTSLIIGVVIGCLITIIIILIILVILMYKRMNRRSKKGKELSRNQDRFLTTIQRWRHVANKSKAERSLRENRSAELRRSFSVPANQDEGISLSPFATRVDIEAGTQHKLLGDVDRADPDGQDGPKIVDDPDNVDGRVSTPSTDLGVDARESDIGSLSPACSRVDSVDSSSYVMVPRNPDGSESNSNSNTLTKAGL